VGVNRDMSRVTIMRWQMAGEAADENKARRVIGCALLEV
jgi:hypothetical protein